MLRNHLNACSNEEVHKHRFHLGLSALEVITANKRFLLYSVLNYACTKVPDIHKRTVKFMREFSEADLIKVSDARISRYKNSRETTKTSIDSDSIHIVDRTGEMDYKGVWLLNELQLP